jgi:YD repeat-containing protein
VPSRVGRFAAALETHAYTPNGREASVTDARGNVTAYGYDGFDRLSSATYAAGTALASSESFAYDADSNLTQRLTRRGDAIVFTYDTLNRLATKAPPAPTPTVNYSYDLMGRLTAVNDNGAAIAGVVPPSPPVTRYTASYSYDARNRLVGVGFDNVNAPVQPTPASVRFDFAYNAANQRTSQQVSDDTYLNRPSGAPTVTYSVNALNQYTAVGAVAPTYDANGNLTFDGSFTYGYDAEPARQRLGRRHRRELRR